MLWRMAGRVRGEHEAGDAAAARRGSWGRSAVGCGSMPRKGVRAASLQLYVALQRCNARKDLRPPMDSSGVLPQTCRGMRNWHAAVCLWLEQDAQRHCNMCVAVAGLLCDHVYWQGRNEPRALPSTDKELEPRDSVSPKAPTRCQLHNPLARSAGSTF